MSRDDFHLGIFAKYWNAGEVKTRLAVTLGEDKAARVHRAFVHTLLSRFSAAGHSRELVIAPDWREQEFRQCLAEHLDSWKIQRQGQGDLGQRMRRFFLRTLARRRKVILIGSDSPTLPRGFLDQASDLLEDHAAVLGPSEDGGYYLVAACHCVPAIFSDVDWGTERVWRQTIEQLQAHGVRYATLPEWYDVDEQRDLQRLCREAEGNVDDEYVAHLSQVLKQTVAGPT